MSITDSDGKEVLFIQSNNATFSSFSEGVYVSQDKRDTRILEGFDVITDLKGMTSVRIDYKKIDDWCLKKTYYELGEDSEELFRISRHGTE